MGYMRSSFDLEGSRPGTFEEIVLRSKGYLQTALSMIKHVLDEVPRCLKILCGKYKLLPCPRDSAQLSEHSMKNASDPEAGFTSSLGRAECACWAPIVFQLHTETTSGTYSTS